MEELCERARAELQLGNLNNAVALLDQALDIDPLNPQVYWILQHLEQNLPPAWSELRSRTMNLRQGEIGDRERRIEELAAKIRSSVIDETEPEKQRRLEAENHLRAARHLASKGLRNGAVNAAGKAISAYPGCIAARQLIVQMKPQNAVEVNTW